MLDTWLLICSLAIGVYALDMQGVNFVGMPYTRVHLSDPHAKQALENLATTGANWISLPVTFFQDFKNSSLSYKGVHPFIMESGINECSPEKDYAHIIREAKSLGLKVMLQSQVHINKPHWPDSREIGDYWGFYNPYLWFNRYFELINSTIAAVGDSGVDMISLGHNFMILSYHEMHWKNLTLKLRNVTDIPLTYSAAYGDEERKSGFWDHLDFVSVFPNFKSTSMEGLTAELKDFNRALLYMNKLWKKPVIVTRVATCSHPHQAISQTALFSAVYDSVKSLDFVKGIFFGDWPADISYSSPDDASYSIQNKRSQKTVTEIFGGSGQEWELPNNLASYSLNCDCFSNSMADS